MTGNGTNSVTLVFCRQSSLLGNHPFYATWPLKTRSRGKETRSALGVGDFSYIYFLFPEKKWNVIILPCLEFLKISILGQLSIATVTVYNKPLQDLLV